MRAANFGPYSVATFYTSVWVRTDYNPAARLVIIDNTTPCIPVWAMTYNSVTVDIPNAPAPNILIVLVSVGVSYAGPDVMQYVLLKISTSLSFATS